MTEYRRILLDGNVVEVTRDGDDLVAGDGRTVAIADAQHLSPVDPGKIIAVHLNYQESRRGVRHPTSQGSDLLSETHHLAERARRCRRQAATL